MKIFVIIIALYIVITSIIYVCFLVSAINDNNKLKAKYIKAVAIKKVDRMNYLRLLKQVSIQEPNKYTKPKKQHNIVGFKFGGAR